MKFNKKDKGIFNEMFILFWQEYNSEHEDNKQYWEDSKNLFNKINGINLN